MGTMTISDLPALNASLNGLSAVLLAAGYYFIRQGRIRRHRNCMIGAVATSTLFLASYLYYHANVEALTRFEHPWFRPVYLAILISHTILAMVLLPLVLVTLYRAARGQFERHQRIARWTWPVWIYVSVTGVIIYLLLYQIFPQR
jgi:putative membrane protein